MRNGLRLSKRPTLGVSGVVAAAFLLIIMGVVIALTWLSFNSLYELYKLQSEYNAVKSKASLIASALESYYDVKDSNLIISIESKYPYTLFISAIAIHYDITYDIISKNVLTVSSGTLTEYLGDIVIKTIPITDVEFPYPLTTGHRVEIEVPLRSSNILSVTASISSSPIVVTIPIKKYQEVTGGAPPQIFDSELMPEIAYEGTSATLGYWYVKESATHTDITVVIGQYVSGDLDSIKHDDNNYYVVRSEPSPNWLEGWTYRRPVTIQENSGTNLVDYAVKIQLNSGNFDFSRAKSDGSDIRFTLDDGTTLLTHWIESWDPVNQVAVVWVKVPNIPAGGSVTIYMYYGNPNAQDASDIRNTFIYGEDLEVDYDGDGDIDNDDMTYAGWQIVSEYRGLWHVEKPGVCNSISYNWYYGSQARGCTYNVGLTRGYIVSPYIDLTGLNVGAKLRFYTRWQIERWAWWGDYDSLYVQIATDSTWNTLWHRDCNECPGCQRCYTTHPCWVYDWHWEEIDISAYVGNRVRFRFRFDSVDGAYNNVEGWHIDEIIVRPYVSPEPSATVGPEQSRIATTSVRISYRVSNPDVLKINFTYIVKYNKAPVEIKVFMWNYSSSSWVEVSKETYRVANTEDKYQVITSRDGYVSSTGDLMVKIESSTLGDHTIYLELANVTAILPKYSMYIALGGTNYVYRYDLSMHEFFKLNDAPFTFYANTSITFDRDDLYLWAIGKYGTGYGLYYYDVLTGQWNYRTVLPTPPGNGSFIIYAYGYIYYLAGGSSDFYKYDVKANKLMPLDSLPVTADDYTVGVYDGSQYIYVLVGTTGEFFRFNESEGWVELSTAPTVKPVGMAYDPDRNVIWVISEGGGLYYYNIASNEWEVVDIQTPYYPRGQGNRLIYYSNFLYHVRADGTREFIIINLSNL